MHGEGRDINFEGYVIYFSNQRIKTVHTANWCFDVTKRDVLVAFVGRQYGLFSHNPFAFYFSCMAQAIVYEPMPPHELHGIRTFVYDGDAVGKHILCAVGHGITRFKIGFNLYGNVVGGATLHYPKMLNRFELLKCL